VLERFPRKNVLTSLLWLTGITLPSGLAASAYDQNPGALIGLGLGVISFLSTLFCYFYWMFKEPDRLQSEDYQLQQAYIANLPEGLPYSAERVPGREAKVVSGRVRSRDE
jgi:hypothetical protein